MRSAGGALPGGPAAGAWFPAPREADRRRIDGAVGDLDRDALDEIRPEIPVRVQHRSGALWVVNTTAPMRSGLAGEDAEGIERDAAGRPTRRLWRATRWLRERLGAAAVPDMAGLGASVCLWITGVTDATPDLTVGTAELLGGALPQRVMLGDPRQARRRGRSWWLTIIPGSRGVAGRRACRGRWPCSVSRAALVIALAAGTVHGARATDRARGCSAPLTSPPCWPRRVTVVTQPSLPARRGDEYHRVEPEDVPFLWPFASLVSAGVAVACSSDAPYGELDPWQAVVAARDRIASSGRAVGPGERVRPAAALAEFPDAAGGSRRRAADHSGRCGGGSGDARLAARRSAPRPRRGPCPSHHDRRPGRVRSWRGGAPRDRQESNSGAAARCQSPNSPRYLDATGLALDELIQARDRRASSST